ncbi:MAG: protoporphyrinogen oxidase [Candidatus Eisenbacteria bacterium]|nr:protoporphyrinogen oxidase [Candidatus Eisenbacteria bacterium]
MRVVVIGAGIAGLTIALRVAQRGAAVTVLEAGETAGGHVQTLREDGFIVEAGPNGYLESADAPEPGRLVGDLGLLAAVIEARPAARRRHVVRGGRLRRVPDSPGGLLGSDALGLGGKLRLLAEPFVPPAPAGREESVHAFARRRVGREAADVLVDTAVMGISAGDSRELSMNAAFPQVTEMEHRHGSLFRAMMARRARRPRLVSFAGGMRTMIDALVARLGPDLRLRTRALGLERGEDGWRIALDGGEVVTADRVVLAAQAAHAAGLVRVLDRELAEGLGAFPFAGLAVVAMAFPAAAVPRALDGYGYLVARSEGLDTLGVVWDSSLFAGRAPEGRVLLRAMMGGARRPEVAALEPDDLVRRARADLATVLGVHSAPARVWAWRRPAAIAQYTFGHIERVARARALAARYPGLELCGTSYDGVSFGAGVASAEAIAARVLGSPDAPRAATPPPGAESARAEVVRIA